MTISTLRQRRAEIERARESIRPAPNRPKPATVRQEIVESWRRCANQEPAPPSRDIAEDAVVERWMASPVNRYAGSALNQLAELVERENFVAAFVERDGLVVWCAGSSALARAAEKSGFTRGSIWSEEQVGTNGPGTAMATGRPISVFANEHWEPQVQDWVCYAAPVRNRYGEVIGALDISTDWKSESGLALATISVMSAMVEQCLANTPESAKTVHVGALGHRRASIYGDPKRLSLRQTEILLVLSMLGEATLDELHDRLHGERSVSPNTTKSEVSGLRRILGPASITSRPYRLAAEISIDAVHLEQAIACGDLETACRLYRGQLLPASESPAIIELRHHIDVALRSALLRSGTSDQLRRFHRVHPFDAEVLRTAHRRSRPMAR